MSETGMRKVSEERGDTHITKPLSQLYKEEENEKKRVYEERVIEAEKGSFTPLVFTTSGGCGPLCKQLVKKLAKTLASVRCEK